MQKIDNYKLAINEEQLRKSFRIVDLKNFLRECKLKVSGNKATLVTRLFNFVKCNNLNNYVNQNNKNVNNDNIPTDYYIKDGIINIYYLYKLVRRKNTYDIDNFEDSVINNTLNKYYLKTEGTLKWVKIKRIYLLAKLLIYYSKYLSKIVLIQKMFRINLKQNYKKYNLPISQCLNTEDFITYDDLVNIPKKYHFVYKDIDNNYYGFDIRSLYSYVNQSAQVINPYNNQKMDLLLIRDIQKFYNILKLKLKLKHKTKIKLNTKLAIRDKAIKIFQIINVELNNYVDVNWFLNLNNYKLKKLYQAAEDIWNYRAQHLDIETKKKHIPNNDAFQMKVVDFYRLNDRFEMQTIILNEFHKFITEGITIDERKTGAMWMLTALVEVSVDACNAMPWLLQT